MDLYHPQREQVRRLRRGKEFYYLHSPSQFTAVTNWQKTLREGHALGVHEKAMYTRRLARQQEVDTRLTRFVETHIFRSYQNHIHCQTI